MERVTFEDALLMHYKKFLQRLEKVTSAVSKGQRKMSREQILMAQIGATCLCELLLEHPYFNFSQNIAQLLVYLLNCNNITIRTKILNCFRQVFAEDKKFELTLFVRNWHLDAIHCFVNAFFSTNFCFCTLCVADCASIESSHQVKIEYGACGNYKLHAGPANKIDQFER